MPTKGKGRNSRLSFQETESNWTDALPICKNTGVGFSTNQIYRAHGHRQEEHSFEEKCFYLSPDDKTFLYGVFDGHDGVQAAAFAHQRIAAELLLEQLAGKSTDEEIKDLLRQAFNAVEKSYLESLDAKVAERTSLQDEIPTDLNSYEIYQKYPDLVDNLDRLNQDLSCGTSAVVALISDGKLYVANVGDSRALLCRTGEDGVLRVQQLSVDHDLSNEDEILRLESLGLKITSNHRDCEPDSCRHLHPPSLTLHSCCGNDSSRHDICHASSVWESVSVSHCGAQLAHLGEMLLNLGNQNNTRCLGNYLVKGAYKEVEGLSLAKEEPIIAEPEISGGIVLDESCRFLLLMSDGLYRSYEEATGTKQVNKEIASMAATEFKTQSTLTGVAQAVVDKVVRKHHDNFMMMSGCQGDKSQCTRDDITLLVRNFNQPLPLGTLPGSTTSPTGATMSSIVPPSEDSSTTTYSGSDQSEKPIHAYVDFSEYYRNVELARRAGNLPPILLDSI